MHVKFLTQDLAQSECQRNVSCHPYILPDLSSLLYFSQGLLETMPDFSCTVDDTCHYLPIWINY